MWFRVELHKDGSVASCETVEGKLKDGKHVFYVEADTKEKALSEVVRKYRAHLGYQKRWHENEQRRRKAAGLCRIGGCESGALNGHRTCAAHHKSERIRSREKYHRLKDPGAARQPAAEEERATGFLERSRLSKGRVAERFGMRTDKLYWARAILSEALAAYDRNPRNFRGWLVAKLKSLGVDADNKKSAEPFAFESAAE